MAKVVERRRQWIDLQTERYSDLTVRLLLVPSLASPPDEIRIRAVVEYWIFRDFGLGMLIMHEMNIEYV